MKKNGSSRIGLFGEIKHYDEKGRKIGVYAVDEEDWLDMGQMSELEKMRTKLYGE